jgi:hypothetical protein
MPFDEEPDDPHGECRHEIETLRAEIELRRESERLWVEQAEENASKLEEAELALEKADEMAEELFARSDVGVGTPCCAIEYCEARAAMKGERSSCCDDPSCVTAILEEE